MQILKATGALGMARRYFTTYETSLFLGVSLPTVVNWIKANRLKAHKTPGGHRRIAREELASFIRRHEMPMPPELGEEGEGARVMVIDDDEHQREILKALFEGKGYAFHAVESGFSAGLAIGLFRPDVVLLDLMMPVMDGFEVLAELRANEGTEGLPVIAMTGLGDEKIHQRVRDSGFNDLVLKPFNFDALLKKVEDVLRGTRQAA
jgi:excisionase family DNA binding protein